MSGPLSLIIDDERNFREFLGEALESEGYTIRHTGTARAGLAIARETLPQVVLLDQNLPDRPGLELLPELRNLPRRPVIIVITAHAKVGYAVDAVKAGAFHYLPKPFAFSDLLDVLAQAAITSGRTEPELGAGGGALGAIVGATPAVAELRRQIARIAQTPVPTVLVQGESGTGKELVAQAIHAASARRAHRFVAVNCAALTDTLLQSELFGHERGAFTDARQQRKGVFELAHGGTLFLDEVSEMGPRAQAALLRVLEQRSVVRVGGGQEMPVDVRVVAATNLDLAEQVAIGRFRADLYSRLNVVRLDVPPLRARAGDVQLLAEHLSRTIAERYAEPPRALATDARALVAAYGWPGNVRELRNAIERAYVIGTGPVIAAADLPMEVRSGAAPGAALAPAASAPPTGFQDAKRHVVGEFERAFLQSALANAGGNVTLAAERAGVLRQVFQRLLMRHGIDHEQFRDAARTRGRPPE